MIRTLQDLMSAGMNPFVVRILARDFSEMRVDKSLPSPVHVEVPISGGKSVWVTFDDVAPEEAGRAQSEPPNTCEHGDHPAPDGQRFCSPECERCEQASDSDEHALVPSWSPDCAGLCKPTFLEAELEATHGQVHEDEDWVVKGLLASPKMARLLKEVLEAPPATRASAFADRCRAVLQEAGVRPEELG